MLSEPVQLPLPAAYSHGDCEHPHPLFDALELGFCNVEADVWLVEDEILVAHDEVDLKPDRTLEELYLRPLWALVKKHAGRVFPGWPEFVLLIDIKNEPERMYQRLKEVLAPYRDMLTSTSADGSVTEGAVRIVLSGERPIETVRKEPDRCVFIDGRYPDLQAPIDPRLMPWVSDNWEVHFGWRGEGAFSDGESAKLRQIVETVHAQQVMLRLWSAPDLPAGWQMLLDQGVDIISTDRLGQLAEFLRGSGRAD